MLKTATRLTQATGKERGEERREGDQIVERKRSSTAEGERRREEWEI